MATNDHNREHATNNDPVRELHSNDRNSKKINNFGRKGGSVENRHADQQRSLASVHDSFRQSCPTILSEEANVSKPDIATDAEKLKSPHHLTRWQSTDDPAYPGIPFQVARYLCESSPDLLRRMEAALHSSGTVAGGSPHRSNGAGTTVPPTTSSLSFMTSMADALALQESVIGSKSVKPASPEIVSQLIQSNRDSFVSIGHRNDSLINPDPTSVPRQNDHDTRGTILSNSRPVVPEATISPPAPLLASPVTSNTLVDPSDRRVVSTMDGDAKELHPFPRERISTVVERTSWFGGGATKEEVATLPPQKPPPLRSSGTPSRTSSSARGTSECNLGDDDVLGIVPNVPKHYGGFNDSASYAASDIESVYSERYELDSNFSERLELQSNMSDVSGIEEEMFRIRKLLLDTPSDSSRRGQEVSHYVQQLDTLRERAAMEGQLEALRVELETSKRERSQLQATLATHQTTLNSQTVQARSSSEENVHLRRRTDELERRLRESEDVVEQLRAAVEMKSEEAALQREDSQATEAESQRLRIALQEMKVDADSRDGAVQGLKVKVAELHTELQNVLQAKNKSDGELVASRNQGASEVKMKEWYRQQLQEAQTLRSTLQQEVIGLQSEKGESESANDRLRFERDQLRKSLAELQQRAVREKEALLRHLETIEADVREREAAYGQLRDGASGDSGEAATLAVQLRRVLEERAQLSEETFARSELERQLEVARAEAAARTETVGKLERDVSQLMKQLTVQQKTAGERDMEIHQCRGVLTQLEAKNRELQVALQTAVAREVALGRDFSASEARVAAALSERRDTDAALVDVRTNIGKLDGRLRYLKEELSTKTATIDQLRADKSALEGASTTREVILEQQRRRLAAAEEEISRLKESVAAGAVNNGAREELTATKEMLVRISEDLDRLVSENTGLRERVCALTDFNVSGSTRDDLSTKLGREVTELRRRLAEAETGLSVAKAGSEKLTTEMAIREAATAAVTIDNEANSEASHDHLRLLQDKLVEKEEAALKMVTATRSAMEELARLEVENGLLKDQLLRRREELLSDRSLGASDELGSAPSSLAFHQYDEEEMVGPNERRFSLNLSTRVHFGTQTEEWRTDDEKLMGVSTYAGVGDNVAAHMEVALRETDEKYRTQRRRHESNIKVLTRKLKEVLKARKRLEEELRETNDKLAEAVANAANTAAESLKRAPAPSTDVTPSSDASRTRDAKISYYRKRIIMMDKKLSETQRLYDVERKRADRNQELLIELEKQKGRLHVMAESNSNIKQHQSELEAVLLERESAISVLDLQAKNVHLRKQQEEAQLRENLKDLQEKLQLEQNGNRDLKKQVFKERFESGGLRKQIASLRSGLEEGSRQMEAKMAETTKLEREIEEQKQIAARLRGEGSSTQDKLLESQLNVGKLQKEVEQSHAKDPLLAEQIKTLGWHLQKKNQELAQAKEQLRQLEEQHQTELRQLNAGLETTRLELAEIKSQLQAALELKFSYQTKLTELRTALKSSHDQNKILQAELTGHLSVLNSNGSSRDRLELKLPDSPAPYDESLIASLLQQSLSLPKNGPLNNLHVCLNTLKQEMAILQQQLLDQTNGDS